MGPRSNRAPDSCFLCSIAGCCSEAWRTCVALMSNQLEKMLASPVHRNATPLTCNGTSCYIMHRHLPVPAHRLLHPRTTLCKMSIGMAPLLTLT